MSESENPDVLELPFGLLLEERGKTALFAFIIGLWTAFGFALVLFTESFVSFGLYLFMLGIFHFLEYFTQILFNPSATNTDGFLLNHSRAYHIANGSCLIEFCVWYYFAPWTKTFNVVSLMGLIFLTTGQVIRTIAQVQAQHNFTHQVSDGTKRECHVLVTHGIYQISRHPSYLGWFMWSVGTQVLLCNPFSFVAFSVATYKFFKIRIQHEEKWLVNYFGLDYINYRKKVPIRIPFLDEDLKEKTQ